jgi:tRNA(Leu) C34 or U34 (ribose-2'-O)-methylase TrmL
LSAHILLIDPKRDYNVGAVVRAAAVFGAESVRWTGDRVLQAGDGGLPSKYRLPREERLKEYQRVRMQRFASNEPARDWLAEEARRGCVPVAIEVRQAAEPLSAFEHPRDALYVFGPEDGTLGRAWLELCHRFVVIPSAIRSPLNLAAAANVVLYDRFAKGLG